MIAGRTATVSIIDDALADKNTQKGAAQ
jgi:hypothetical protein